MPQAPAPSFAVVRPRGDWGTGVGDGPSTTTWELSFDFVSSVAWARTYTLAAGTVEDIPIDAPSE